MSETQTETPASADPAEHNFLAELTPELNAALLGDNEICSFLAAWIARNVLASKGGAHHHLLVKLLRASRRDHGIDFTRRVAQLIATNAEHHHVALRVERTFKSMELEVKHATTDAE